LHSPAIVVFVISTNYLAGFVADWASISVALAIKNPFPWKHFGVFGWVYEIPDVASVQLSKLLLEGWFPV
jgi:hypothetical protein